MMEGRGEEGGGGRAGTGGKMTRQSVARKAPAATPYDRPQPSEGAAPHLRVWREGDEGGERGWFSKAKLLLRPASRVLPPFFSPFAASPSPSYCEDLAGPGSSGAPRLEVEQDSHVDITKQVFNSQASHLNETGSSAGDDHPKGYSETDEHAGGRLGNTYDGIGFVDIEQRLKQKTFSRDESNRLIEILRSRTTDLAEDDKCEVGFMAHDVENAWGQKCVRRSVEEKKPVQMNLRDRKERVFDEVGASPVEIAKAFMEFGSSTSHQVFHGGILRADKIPSCDCDSPNSSMTLVAQTPQICWPGTVVQADHDYFTPQSQRGRARLHDIPRSLFPGESFQTSIAKFQGSSERCPNLSFTGWKQSPTPVFGTNKKRISTPGDGQTAVPPILGQEQKNMTMSASKGANPYSSASFRSSLSARSDVFEGSTFTMQKNLEPGALRCDNFKHKTACTENDSWKTAAGLLRVHPKSSEVARKILEHLDRTVPLPQNKPFQSEFLIEKQALPPSGVTKMLNGQDNKPCPGSPSTSFLFGGDVISGNAELQKKSLPLCQSFGSEYALTAISVSKPEKAPSFPDNGFGFSFPASVASNASCGPPAAPTVALHSPASEEGIVPSFSFGSSIAGSRPIFSFGPVVNSASIRVADSYIRPYRFGSDESSRLSFRSFGNDAVCY